MFLAQTITRGGHAIATAEVEAAAMNLDGRPRRLPSEIVARFGLERP
jgi:acyl-CoA thioesterase FadM